MSYSIGQVSRMTNITISTLRYYDREGLFPDIERSNGGIRLFSDAEVDILRMIECLKMTDMPIKDIKQFLDWCQEGDGTIEKRRDMFYERLEVMNRKMVELQKTIDTIKYKCWYYDTAVSHGTETAPRNMPIETMPADIQRYKLSLMAQSHPQKSVDVRDVKSVMFSSSCEKNLPTPCRNHS